MGGLRFRGTRRFFSRHPALTMLLTTLFFFAALTLTTELALRLIIGPNNEQEALFEIMRSRALNRSNTKLVTPPTFLTDALGIWVANPEMPGINPEGYRSPPFDEDCGNKARIMLLGDSFTYGLTASSMETSFAGRVRRAGYCIYNLGIPGTGIGQYLAQAQHYVPRLKPDVVAVVLYPGDDFQIEPPVRPGLNRNYVTNYGLLPALTSDGTPISFDDAADSFAGFTSDDFAGKFRRFCMATAIAKLALMLFTENNDFVGDIPKAREQLRAIAEIAKENNSKFMLFVLPVRKVYQNPTNDRAHVLSELAELSPLEPGPYDDEALFAPMPDPHYNDAGHARFAAYMMDELKKAGITAGNTSASPVPGN